MATALATMSEADTLGCAGHVDILMPALGKGVESAVIIQWMKSVGNRVESNEPLVEISTDKVDTEVVSPTSGVLSETRATAGQSVAVGVSMGTVCPSNCANNGEIK